MRHNRITGKAGQRNPANELRVRPLFIPANNEHGQRGEWPGSRPSPAALRHRRREATA